MLRHHTSSGRQGQRGSGMERVTGIGGVFMKARDVKALSAWYRDALGVPLSPYFAGAKFSWPEGQRPDRPGTTAWSLFPEDSTYFAPSTAPFMINFRVDNLDAMLAQLRAFGAAVDERVEQSEFGRFGWVMDPEGNRVELWEPPPGK
ncbi:MULTISPECIES: VOC family protein [Nitrospirillum]|nr:VOC family protein [Nitrospirillum amazonense]MEC4591230.1 VOC family protein [Nitrospirillum amazonense]